MIYHTTLLEDTVTQIYDQLQIYQPDQLDMIAIAKSLKTPIHFEPISSRTFDGEIIIDSRLSPEEQWEDFGHELCHILLQHGNQIININTLFLEYQEWKAKNFTLHFCVPTFMLKEYKISTVKEGIYIIKNKFNVTDEIAQKRLNHYRNQLIQSNHEINIK